jgi:hypothetical protein
MKTQVQSIQLNPDKPAQRVVKRSALLAFTALRGLAKQSSKVPGLLAQASKDIKEAWQESARPNV